VIGWVIQTEQYKKCDCGAGVKAKELSAPKNIGSRQDHAWRNLENFGAGEAAILIGPLA
jgi:hypothetical protein